MFRDVKWLSVVRNMPCLTCPEIKGIEAAHIRKGSGAGKAEKPSDDRVVPLCHKCHAEQHRIGELTFWYPYGGYEKAAVIAKKLYKFWDEGGDILPEVFRYKNELQNHKQDCT